MFVRMLLEASIKKMRLREQLTRLVKDPASLPVFRNLFADEKGLVELKKVIKLFDGSSCQSCSSNSSSWNSLNKKRRRSRSF
jgi:hypothetical protein